MAFQSLESSSHRSSAAAQLFSTFVSLSSTLSSDTEVQAAASDILHRVQGKDMGIMNLHTNPLGQGSTFSVSYIPQSNDDDEHSWDAVVFKRTIPSLREQDEEKTRRRLASMMLELRVLAHNPIRKCENIVKLLGIAWEADPFLKDQRWPVFVIERASHGTLLDYLQQNESVSFKSRLSLSLDVTTGLEVLHRCDIFHGDLKLENILIFDNEDPETQAERPLIAKLADFGGVVHDVTEDTSLPTRTKIWAAPETSRPLGSSHIAHTDIYALGFVIWRILAGGKDPFEMTSRELGLSPQKAFQVAEETKQSDETLFEQLRSAARFDNEEESAVATAVVQCTIRIDPKQRNLAAVKLILQDLIDGHRTPLEIEGLAEHQWLLRQQFVLFTSEGMENLDRSIARYVSRELEFAVDNTKDPIAAGEAAYGLAVLFINDIIENGSNDTTNKDSWLALLARSALTGNDRARAYVWRASRALQADLTSQLGDQLAPWLEEAGSRGFFTALDDLSRLGLSDGLRDAKKTLQVRYGGTGADRFGGDMYPESFPSRSQLFEAGLLQKFKAGNNFGGYYSRFGDRLLHFAASGDFSNLIEAYLKQNIADIDTTNVNGETPLLLACRAGNLRSTMMLLEAGANASVASDYGDTPLHWLLSFEGADVSLVGRKILGSHPELDAIAEQFSYIHCGENGFVNGTPLMRAVSRNRLDVVEFLLEAGADANFTTLGCSAINLAAQLHYPEVLSRLLLSSQDRRLSVEESTGRSLLIPAITGGSLEAPGTLFGRIKRHGEDLVRSARETLKIILNAAASGDLEDIPGWSGGTALVLAVTFARQDVVEFLLENGCLSSINVPSTVPNDPEQLCTPLMMSILSRNLPVLKLLLDHGADAKRLHQIKPGVLVTGLYECARHYNDSASFAQALFDAGVSLNQTPEDYETPLGCAVRSRCFELATTLIDLGADLEVEYSSGLHMETRFSKTLLGHLLQECSLGSLACLKFLFRFDRDVGPDFIVCKHRNLSSLHVLAGINSAKQEDRASRQIFELLLDHFRLEPSDLDLKTTDKGMTALHYGAFNANDSIVKRLLEEGAEVDVKNADGFTPLDMAIFALQEFPATYRLGDTLKTRTSLLRSIRRKAEAVVKLLEEASEA